MPWDGSRVGLGKGQGKGQGKQRRWEAGFRRHRMLSERLAPSGRQPMLTNSPPCGGSTDEDADQDQSAVASDGLGYTDFFEASLSAHHEMRTATQDQVHGDWAACADDSSSEGQEDWAARGDDRGDVCSGARSPRRVSRDASSHHSQDDEVRRRGERRGWSPQRTPCPGRRGWRSASSQRSGSPSSVDEGRSTPCSRSRWRRASPAVTDGSEGSPGDAKFRGRWDPSRRPPAPRRSGRSRQHEESRSPSLAAGRQVSWAVVPVTPRQTGGLAEDTERWDASQQSEEGEERRSHSPDMRRGAELDGGQVPSPVAALNAQQHTARCGRDEMAALTRSAGVAAVSGGGAAAAPVAAAVLPAFASERSSPGGAVKPPSAADEALAASRIDNSGVLGVQISSIPVEPPGASFGQVQDPLPTTHMSIGPPQAPAAVACNWRQGQAVQGQIVGGACSSGINAAFAASIAQPIFAAAAGLERASVRSPMPASAPPWRLTSIQASSMSNGVPLAGDEDASGNQPNAGVTARLAPPFVRSREVAEHRAEAGERSPPRPTRRRRLLHGVDSGGPGKGGVVLTSNGAVKVLTKAGA